jgi:hypothetical protein
MENNEQFNAAYWAAQALEIQALHAARVANPGLDQTADYTRLAMSGFKIDKPIMVDNQDPWKVMTALKAYGYTWVPSALMNPVQIAPGLDAMGNSIPYDAAKIPDGAIKVSIDISDYPPVIPPPLAPVTDAPAVLVGSVALGHLYLTVRGDTSPEGTKYTDSRGTFIKRVSHQVGGTTSAYWELLLSQSQPV